MMYRILSRVFEIETNTLGCIYIISNLRNFKSIEFTVMKWVLVK